MGENVWKATLCLPETEFPMRASLATREPERIAWWRTQDTYRKLDAARADAPLFLLHDGPPYANGDLHMGHTLNKVLKDIVVKYKRLQGFRAPYVPGWDCHGLPIELKSIEESGSGDPAEVRAHCRSYARRFVDRQREQFERLGILGDWDEPYLTLNAAYEAETLRSLADLQEHGLIRRGDKPVHWCTSCETALAEAEVEYGDHTSHSLYVMFPLVEPVPGVSGKAHLLIWTTTPWTLPANLAVAVAADAEYGVYPTDTGPLVCAVDLAGQVFAARETTPPTPSVILRGQDLVGLVYRHPFLDRTGQVYAADFVALDTGSGMVHIAPGHGDDDYKLGKQVGLDPLAPVDGKGLFYHVADWLDGKHVWKGNGLVLDRLSEDGLVWSVGSLQHSYPHCWRCSNPIIFRATPQWFVSMQAESLREKCLTEIENVNWIPGWGHERIHAMMENRPDWCISRQRVWGVPFGGLHCNDCHEEYLDPAFMRSVADHFEKTTSDAWFDGSRPELLAKADPCPHCGSTNLSGTDDILDVWYDSGISWRAAVEKDPRLGGPVDMYLEGSDQHRGWFQSSLLLSVGLQGAAPYRNVLTHGFVVDGNGYKMSKSRGNVMQPSKVWDQNGAEILRIWCASEDYSMDVRVSPEILKQSADAYRRIRNTIKYLLGNLAGFDPLQDSVPAAELFLVDRMAQHQLRATIKQVEVAYEDFQFHRAFQTIHNYCTNALSGFYLDVLKDRLYCDAPDGKSRASARTVLREILDALVVMMSPIVSFTAEEAWQLIPWAQSESVNGALWPKVSDVDALDPDETKVLDDLLALRRAVNVELDLAKKEKIVGGSQAAAVVLTAPADMQTRLVGAFGEDLPGMCMVSSLTFTGTTEDLQVDVRPHEGEKCPRCWNYQDALSARGLCVRCEQVAPQI